MKKSILILFISISCFLQSYQGKVIELTYLNGPRILEETDAVIMLFYSEDCGFSCQEWEDLLNKTSEVLSGRGYTDIIPDNIDEESFQILRQVKFGRVNGIKLKTMREQFEVTHYPSIRFVRDRFGIVSDFPLQDKSVIDIIQFLYKKIIRKWTLIKSLEQLDSINEASNINLLACGGDDLQSLVTTVSAHYEDLKLSKLDTSNPELTNHFNCSQNEQDIYLFKHFDESKVRYFDYTEQLDQEDLDHWLATFTSPIVVEFNNDNLQLVLQKSVPCVAYFYKERVDKESFDVFYKHAKQHRTDIIFLKGEYADEFSNKMIRLMGINEEQLPTIIAVKTSKEGKLKKYKLKKPLTQLSEGILSEFINTFITNSENLKEYSRSEKLNFTNPYYTRNEGEEIYKVINKNFNDLIMRRGETCWLLYAYLNPSSDLMNNLYGVSRKLSELDLKKNVKIGMINVELNEILVDEIFTLTIYPSIKNHNNTTEIKQIKGKISIKTLFQNLYDSGCFSGSSIDSINEIEFSKEENREEGNLGIIDANSPPEERYKDANKITEHLTEKFEEIKKLKAEMDKSQKILENWDVDNKKIDL
jgi:hypothetical protein